LIPLIIPSLAPTSALAGLQALQSEGLIYGTTWILYLVSDLLYLVAFFGLFYALRQSGSGLAKAAVTLNTAFVALDVGLDIPLRLWLILLSNSYVTSTVNLPPEIASASFAISASNEVAIVATLFQFVALVIVSFLMTKNSSFGRRNAYLGFATGIVALLFIPAFIAGSQLSGIFNIVGFLLLFFWSVLSGLRLRKLSKSL
jgi:hypothetical protein